MNRRQFLRGLGATGLLLPLMPALDLRAAQGDYPRRLLIVKIPEGTEKSTWFPSSAQDLITPALESLRPFANQISIVQGLTNKGAADHEQQRFPYPSVRNNGDFHDVSQIHLLTGGKRGSDITVDGLTLRDGESVDRLIGKKLHGSAGYASPPQLDSSVPAYHLGVHSKLTAQLGAYADTCSCISYPAWQQYTFSQDDPIVCFHDLLSHVNFEGQPMQPDAQAEERRRKLLLGQSILDDVHAEAQALRCRVGVDGRDKLDAYLEGVRGVERQIEDQLQAAQMDAPTGVPPVAGIDRARGNNDWRNEKYHDVIGEIQMNIITSAFAADAKRVLTLSWSHTISDIKFDRSFDGQVTLIPDMRLDTDHHGIAHENRGSFEDSLHDKRKIDRFYGDRLGQMLSKLHAIPEGDGTLLDHTLVVLCSEMGYGTHDFNDLPFLLAGMGDTFKHGQLLNFNNQRAQNDLLTAIAQGFDINLTSIGTAAHNVSPLTELLL